MIDPVNPDYANTPVSPKRPRFTYAPADPSAPPCVTIVTPFHNPGPIFHETARSVLQQSLQQWEWLIVNDGSTDSESLSILEGYRHIDSRIRVLDHGVNRGPSAARNTGFQAAKAPYVVQLDTDNLLEPTAIEKWLWFLESYPEFSFVKGYSVGFGAHQYLWPRGFRDGDVFLEKNVVDATSAIRKAVHEAVGGYDEAIREGLEDWDFWLRCASLGYWGGTIPEYLDWYRRRPAHRDRWPTWDEHDRQRAFLAGLRQRYPKLWNDGFPTIEVRQPLAYDIVPDTLPWENRLRKNKSRVLLLVPWLTFGGADKFNLDVLELLTRRGWEVTVATTLTGEHPWLPKFARYTSDIFVLHHFLRLVDYPRFLQYLIGSRQVDVVLISHSELGYLLLPYLRAHFPEVTFIDYCHIEVEEWKNGGYPRMAVDYQELLDLNIVSSEHLKKWMVQHDANPQRIFVCYTDIDPDMWQPNPERRAAVRQELDLDETLSVILYAGRIWAQKQPHVFAHTMRELRRHARPFVALVAGDGPDFRWLHSFVRRHGLESRVRLLGAVSNQRIRELMTAADIFFLPSQWEGIALSIYEAMACGLPVVGAEVGGQRELVTPECGVLVQRSDEKTEARHYAEALADLLRDPTRRRDMGQAGRRRVSAQFRLEQMADRMAFLFQEAARLHAAQPRSVPSRSLGRTCAAQAVEYTRLSEVASGLWRERERLHDRSATFNPGSIDQIDWRRSAYFAIRRLLLPYYHAALERDMKWLFALKERLKEILHKGRS